MRHPPPDHKERVASAVTPTTPNRASSVAGKQNSQRRYTLARPSVNPQASSAVPCASRDGTDAAYISSPAELAYFEICRTQTGRELPPEIKEQQNEARRLLLAQSYRIADALESEDIKAYGESKLSLVGVLSGAVVELPDFRNIVFIPSVAQRKRHKTLKHLEYFMQEHPYSRMWVFTSGSRVPLSGVRDRISELHRKLSRLNAETFMKTSGVQMVFRSTELGEVHTEDTGEPTFHIHAHVIIDLKGKLPAEQWSRLLAVVRKFWKHHFADSQRIQQAREACKYVVKPNDLDKLTSPQLAELHRQLFRLHLVQCLGTLKDQRKQIEESRSRLVRIPDGLNSRWEIVAEWNAQRKSNKSEEGCSYDSAPDDWVVCTLQPSFALSARSEPLAVVLNYKGKRFDENRRIKMLRKICGSEFT